MSALVCAVMALACATMRNGSVGPVDAIAYTVMFWVWLVAAALLVA